MPKHSPEQLLQIITDAHPGLVAYISNDYRYEFASKSYNDWFGVAPSDVLGKTMAEIVGVDNFENCKPFIDRALRGEEVTSSGVVNHTRLGKREVERVHKPNFAADGSVAGVIMLEFDVTEQKTAERISNENEARFRSLTENMPQLVWEAKADGYLIWFNENWGKATGTKNEDSLGVGWLELLHPDDRLHTIVTWRRGMKNQSQESAEYRLKMADGTYRWHLTRAFPVFDDEGNLVKWIGTTTDIQQQKEIEVYQSRLLQVIDSSSDFIGMSDIAGMGIYLNRAAYELVGLDPGLSVSDLKISEFFLEEDREFFFKTIFPATVRDGKWVGEFRFRHFKTGRPIWVHYNSFLTYDPDTKEPTGFATVTRDITEIKLKEQSLQAALTARDHFLSMASHELKTPLTSLKLHTQLQIRSLDRSKAISFDKLEASARQTNVLVNRLTHLIDDMLDVSRINSGKLRLNKVTCDLSELIREVLLRMSCLFEAAEIVVPKLEPKYGVEGQWDRLRIEQVIENLLTNALRYGRGKPATVVVTEQGDHAIMTVKDQGYGIMKDDLSRIFERFERATTTAEVSGLGLGLYISREIVEAHGGKITVESIVGQGSEFCVSLPKRGSD